MTELAAETVKEYVCSVELGTVLRPTQVSQELGGDPTVGLMACLAEGLVVAVYAHNADTLTWLNSLTELGSASSVDPSRVQVGFRRC